MLWCTSTVALGPRPPPPRPPPGRSGAGAGRASRARGPRRGDFHVDVHRVRRRPFRGTCGSHPGHRARRSARRAANSGTLPVKSGVTLITGSPFAAYAATSNVRMIAGVFASCDHRIGRVGHHAVVDVLEQDLVASEHPSHDAGADRLSAVARADRGLLQLGVPQKVLVQLVLRNLVEQVVGGSLGDAMHLEDALVGLRRRGDDFGVRPRSLGAAAALARLSASAGRAAAALPFNRGLLGNGPAHGIGARCRRSRSKRHRARRDECPGDEGSVASHDALLRTSNFDFALHRIPPRPRPAAAAAAGSGAGRGTRGSRIMAISSRESTRCRRVFSSRPGAATAVCSCRSSARSSPFTSIRISALAAGAPFSF